MDNASSPLHHGQRERHYLSPGVAAGLRNARRKLGLSYRIAAGRTGVDAGMICKLEHCQRAPSVAVAQAPVDGLRLEGDVAAGLMAEAVRDAGRSWRAPGSAATAERGVAPGCASA